MTLDISRANSTTGNTEMASTRKLPHFQMVAGLVLFCQFSWLCFQGPAFGQEVVDAKSDGQVLEQPHTAPFPPPRSNLRPQSDFLTAAPLKDSNFDLQLQEKPSHQMEAEPYKNTHIDVLTYHYDNKRSGWNNQEFILSPTSLKSPRFVLLKTLAVEGNVFAQPLLVSSLKLADSNDHDLLIIATGANNIYAFDANDKDYKLIWFRKFGEPQQTSLLYSPMGCQDVQPEYGISSTPVIVRKNKDKATMYIVSAVEQHASASTIAGTEFHTYIHAIDVATGDDVTARTEISPSDGAAKFDPHTQWVRAALAYNNGSIYVSVGSHCDHEASKLTGWVLKYSEDLQLQAKFHTVAAPKAGLASIWMTGFAPAVDSAGNLFLVTGNGDVSPPDNYGQSVLKLDGEFLKVIDYFTPSNFPLLNRADGDFGSGGIVLLPQAFAHSKKEVAAVIGKDPVFYLLDQANLGKMQPGDAGATSILRIKSCTYSSVCRAVWGGPAFFQSQKGPILFMQAEDDVLRSFLINDTASAPTLVLTTAAGLTKAGYGGSIPVVSSEGNKNGIVWQLRRSEPIELEAYDAEGLGAPLCSAYVGYWSNPSYGSHGNSFLTPMVANGRVYAAAYGVVKVFGMAPDGVPVTGSGACGSTDAAKTSE